MAPMSKKIILLAFCLSSAASALHGCVGSGRLMDINVSDNLSKDSIQGLGEDEAAENTGSSTNTQTVPGADKDDKYHFWCTNDFMEWVATEIVDNLGGNIDCSQYG